MKLPLLLALLMLAVPMVAVAAESRPRVGLVLKADLRPGFTGELTGKVERLEAALERRRTSRADQ